MQNTVEYGGGIYAEHATVNVNGGTISGHIVQRMAVEYFRLTQKLT